MGPDEKYQRLMRGIFVIFEGIDGSGKSTTIAEIHGRLAERGVRSVMLREPTEKTDASREIRRILRTATEVDDKVSRDLLELFLIDRLWDVRTQIEPAVNAGHIVLMDRYYLSTAAYQGKDIGQTQEIMNDYLAEKDVLKPDMLVYLKLPVKTAMARLTGRESKDVFETESRLTAIANRYEEAVKSFEHQFPRIPVIKKAEELRANDYDALTSQILAIQQVVSN